MRPGWRVKDMEMILDGVMGEEFMETEVRIMENDALDMLDQEGIIMSANVSFSLKHEHEAASAPSPRALAGATQEMKGRTTQQEMEARIREKVAREAIIRTQVKEIKETVKRKVMAEAQEEANSLRKKEELKQYFRAQLKKE